MDRENTSFDDCNSSQDEIQTVAQVTASSATSDCNSSSTDSTVPKTARDKFFTNLQNEMEKKDGKPNVYNVKNQNGSLTN